jgi:hypothetical protein
LKLEAKEDSDAQNTRTDSINDRRTFGYAGIHDRYSENERDAESASGINSGRRFLGWLVGSNRSMGKGSIQ